MKSPAMKSPAMKSPIFQSGFLFLLAGSVLIACGKDEPVDTGDLGLTGPEMVHEAATADLFESQPLPLEVLALDAEGVNNIDVFFRTVGATYWENRPLEEANAGQWLGELPGVDIQEPGVEYYFRAADMGTPSASSYLPVKAADAPFALVVHPRGGALPYVEDFEKESLYQSGWVNVANGFQGYPWDLSGLESYSGDKSIEHARGVEGIDPMDDYLISPALDFSQETEVQVSWVERGSGINVELKASLWISVGSRDPADEEFQLVEDLPLAENSVWRRSPVVNLTAWAGEPVVYLAWRYEGYGAGDWFMDDISVKALSCDAKMSLAWAPNPVHPGDVAALTVHLDNPVDATCADVSVGMAVDAAAGILDTGSVAVGELIAQGSTSADFNLTIDPDWPDNTYLPLEVTVNADGNLFTETLILTVGQASAARLDLDLVEEGLIQVSLGVGDPDDPEWEDLMYAASEAAGPLALNFDITDKEPYLGPGPGDERWWARIFTLTEMSVQAFELDFGDSTFVATVLPSGVPGQELLVYLPEPPRPLLLSAMTTPNPVAPGDTVSLTLQMVNAGAITADVTVATLISTDSSVTLVDAGPYTVGSDAWPGGTVRSANAPFQIQVDADHRDSTAVSLSVHLDDGAESWTLPFSVDVPWPVLKIMALRIDDSVGGDGDGLLEPGESAELEIDIVNAGDLSASGVVVADLTIGSNSTAVASTPGVSDTLGTFGVGKTRTADFEITVDATSVLGDTVDLQLSFTDNSEVYNAEIQVVLGELPWMSLAAIDDSSGDSNSYGFDLLNAQWRTDGVTMAFRFEAAAAFDQSKDYAEAWMISAGGDYSFYRLMLQGSTARLQGYDSGFVNLSQPSLSFPDATHAVLEWSISDMGQLTTNNFNVGLGAGWCQVATGSFCDHFPNGWGYYYHNTYNPSGFFPISW
jgi:hypothetical protein